MCVCDVAVFVFEHVGGLTFTDAEEQEDVLTCSSDGDGQKGSRRIRGPREEPVHTRGHRFRAVSMRTVL